MLPVVTLINDRVDGNGAGRSHPQEIITQKREKGSGPSVKLQGLRVIKKFLVKCRFIFLTILLLMCTTLIMSVVGCELLKR